MRKGLHTLGAMAISLLAPHLASAQSVIPIPPPGTPVGRNDVPAHVAPAVSDRADKSANRKILNTTTAQIDYRIETVGPSGIGKVEIYITPDRGVSWVKLAEDVDKQSPATVKLPGEGLFGIRLAITNGNGFGGRAPKAGDRPAFFVEVDVSSPTVAIQPYELVPNLAAIDLRWTAIDSNLAPEPVSIFVRGNPNSQWSPIAKNIKNDGSYRWNFPPNVSSQIFLKLEVVDLAGNVTKVETPTPILLDQSEPEVTLVDVTPIHRGSTPPASSAPLAAPIAAPLAVPMDTPASAPPVVLPAPPTVPVIPVSSGGPAAIPPSIPASMPASLPTLPPVPTLP